MLSTERIKDGTNYGIGAASGYAACKYAPRIICKPMKIYMKKTIKNVPKEDNDIYYSASQKAYENSILNKTLDKSTKYKGNLRFGLFPTREKDEKITKRANIVHIDTNNRESVANEIKEKLFDANEKRVVQSRLFKLIFGDKYKLIDKATKAVAKGENAFCIPRMADRSSLIVVNKDKAAFTTFHEMGHAINAHSTGYKKFLNVTRGLFALLVPVTLFAGLLLNKPKETNPQRMTKEQKCRKFIKDNCGIIASALMLPTLAEEGLASINASKLAKGVMDNNMCKKLNKLNTKAWCSYLAGTVILGATVQGGVKLRDKIVDYKPIK